MLILIVRSILIILFIALALRIMGRRQIGELQTGEFVIAIMLSEVASLPIVNREIPILYAVVPIVILVVFELLFSMITLRKTNIEDVFSGKPVLVVLNGRILQSELTNLRISASEFLEQLREENIENINDIYYAIIETNGTLTLCKNEDKAAANLPVLIDGSFFEPSMTVLDLKEKDVLNYLEHSKTDIDDVYILFCSPDYSYKLITVNK